MVLVNHFSIKIVNAETNMAFQEHVGPNGDVYVEVEPDADYFIEVNVVGGDGGRKWFDICIDGQEWRSCTTQRQCNPYLMGMCTRQNGVDTVKSFRFQKAKISSQTGPNLASNDGTMGGITVKVFEALFAGNEDYNFADPGCAPKSVTSQSDLVQTKKVLRTGAGTVTRTIKRTLAKRYVPGVLAQEIRLNYCTALGLIHAGVLPKPPLWVFHRMKHGVVKRSAMDGVGGTRKRTKRSDATLTATHSS